VPVDVIDLAKLDASDFAKVWLQLSEDERLIVSERVNRQYRSFEDDTAGALAERLDTLTVQTPALRLIDEKLVGIRDAVGVMYQRRARFAQLLRDGGDHKRAIDQSNAEIPPKGITRLILNMPPQEGKSWRVSRYGLIWLLRQFPELRIALVSYDGVNAGQFSYQIRSDIELFNGVADPIDLGLRLASDEKAKSRWLLTAGGSVYAIGIGGGLTGRPVDLMTIDDPVKDYRDADSTLKSENAWDWWQTVGRPRLAPWSPVILVSTRWSEYDLAGRLIAKQREDEAAGIPNADRWDVLNIPAQADHHEGERDVLGRVPGQFMISARGRTDEDWLSIKHGIDPRFWSALYQGSPAPETGTIFLKEWWRTYDTVLWTQAVDGGFRVEGYDLTQSWDFTFRDTKGSDYVVGQVWAKKGADSYLIYQVRARLSFVKTVEAVRRVSALFPQARRKIIETKANGDAIVDTLRHEIPGIIGVDPDQSKEARAKAVAFFVQAGNVHIPSARVASAIATLAFSVAEFVAECTSFNNGAHDDQVDALTQYLKVAYIQGTEGSILSAVGRTISLKPTTDVKMLTPIQKRLALKAGS
jgi:predicted phage terminase large subunit-like protein